MRREGYLLLPVLLMIGVIASVSFLISVQGGIGSHLARTEAEGDVAEYVARAALHHANWLAQGPACGGDAALPWLPLGDHEYRAEVESNTDENRTYRLFPDRDTWVSEREPDAAHGDDAELVIENRSGESAQALYHFDVSSLGDATRVASARLWLHVLTADPEASVELHAFEQAWTEGDATWNTTRDATDPSVLAAVPRQTGDGAFVALDLTGPVQAWLSNPGRNQGLLLVATSTNRASRLAARSFGSQAERPYLEVATSSGEPSPVRLLGEARLLSGIGRTRARVGVRAFQPPAEFVYAPGVGIDDAYVEQGLRALHNFGASAELEVERDGDRNALLRFELAALPRTARVFDARLELYLERAADLEGVLTLHRLLRSFVEGDADGAPPGAAGGVTFAAYDGVSPWTEAGGDFDPEAISSLAIDTPAPGFYGFDVTSQVKRWLEGSDANHGLLLRASEGNVRGVGFASGDAPQRERRPQLRLRLSCECGRTCTLPRGEGNVLMIVGDPAALAPGDRRTRRMLQSFGYGVSLLDDGETATAFRTALDASDVALAAGSAGASALAGKLSQSATGIVSELAELGDELGLVSSSAALVGASVTVSPVHYITELFPSGPLALYTAAMRGAAATGATAPDLETLVRWDTGPGLVLLERGARTLQGTPSPGRRVQLPHAGGEAIDWDHTDLVASLVLQRALQWAARAESVPPAGCDGTFADGFPAVAYDGDEGTLGWAGDWQEIGESDGPNRGRVTVGQDTSSSPTPATFQLELRDQARGLVRGLDLAAAERALLSLAFRHKNLDDPNDFVTVEISKDGPGGPFTEVARIAGPTGDAAYQSLEVDVTAHASATSALRFVTSTRLGTDDRVWLDDVRVSCEPR